MDYPRSLSAREKEWLAWILPPDREGYRVYRDLVAAMHVIGEGRRGEGEIILGMAGAQPDFSAPLPSVFAYGAIETNFGTISVTFREPFENQISVEIVNHRSEKIPDEFEESRRWTYSYWNPGDACPQCQKNVREVSMHASENERFVLAVCVNDKRLWVYDEASRVNRLVPVTNFYNELMLHKNIRDPKIALDHKRLFTELTSYSDADLTYAFFTYNKLKTKIHIGGTVTADKGMNKGIGMLIKKVFSGSRQK